jgi:hypothetical protein
MKEASGKKSSTHAAKLGPKTLELDGEDVMIHFSPQVVQAMKKLHELVRGNHEKFDDDVAGILESFASGKPCDVPTALGFLMTVSRETGECRQKTGDDSIRNALENVITALGDFRRHDTAATTLVVPAKARNR